MIFLPLVIFSLHALAVYSAPTFNDNDAAVLRRAGGMIHGLTLRREEHDQLPKRVGVEICDVPARLRNPCKKRYPPTSTKQGRTSSSRTKAVKPGHHNVVQSKSSSGSKDSSDPDYVYKSDSSEDRPEQKDVKDMEESEKWGDQCDHLVELQTVDAVLKQYCTTPGIHREKVIKIRDYLNDPEKNLYLIKGDVNSAKLAATKHAISLSQKPKDSRPNSPPTWDSELPKSAWVGLVQYLKAMETIAKANAVQIKTDSGLNQDVDEKIQEIYEDTLAIAQKMSSL